MKGSRIHPDRQRCSRLAVVFPLGFILSSVTSSRATTLTASLIALFYAEFGDQDEAFRWLNTAYQQRDTYLVGLKTDFELDTIRSDPRYAELVRKIGLPP